MQPSHCPVPSHRVRLRFDWSPISSWRSSIMLLDQPRKSSTPKYCQNLVPRRSQLDMHRPRGSIVLRLSPMDLPIGDLLALMSADWTDTPTINYVRTDPTFVCQRAASAFLPRFTTELSVPLSCSPKCEVLGVVNASAWAHCGVHPSHQRYPLPATYSVRPRPSPGPESPSYGLRCSLRLSTNRTL